MRGFFKFGNPIIELAIEGRKMELFHDCRIVIERSHDTIEVSKTKH